MFNPKIAAMRVYPTDRKRQLFEAIKRPIVADLTIGEPQHDPDPRVLEILNQHAGEAIGRYPKTRQENFLTDAIIEANIKNKQIPATIERSQVLAGCGSGELLYSFAGACLDPEKPYILIPNPAYQVYRVATEFAGGVPYFFNLTKENNFQPDFSSIPAEVLARTSLCYLNNPNNPCAVCYSEETLQSAVLLARKYNFVLASDECYIDIYIGAKPLSILEVCAKLDGDTSFKNVVAFDTLSKRSSLPGLRSGSMVGDARIITSYLKLRLSERKVLPLHVQRASAYAWTNFVDVEKNRKLYQEKANILSDSFSSIGWNVAPPPATFYGWIDISSLSEDDEAVALDIAQKTGVLTFPGSYFSLVHNGVNPGAGFLRIALIDSIERTKTAVTALTSYLQKPVGKV
jgi:N-succinyldiaminopimelate aminotransferase